MRISKEEYRKDIRRLQMFLSGKKKKLINQLQDEMRAASKSMEFEKAAKLRDEIEMLNSLDRRESWIRTPSRKFFTLIPRRG